MFVKLCCNKLTRECTQNEYASSAAGYKYIKYDGMRSKQTIKRLVSFDT